MKRMFVFAMILIMTSHFLAAVKCNVCEKDLSEEDRRHGGIHQDCYWTLKNEQIRAAMFVINAKSEADGDNKAILRECAGEIAETLAIRQARAKVKSKL